MSTYQKPDLETLIIGAGPVGLFSAHCLLKRGISVRIVDEEWRTAAHSYALALHPRSLELLDDLGLAESVLERGRCIDSVAFYEGSARRAELSLAELPGRHPYVLVMPQSDFEHVLEESLKAKRTPVQWNHRVPALEVNESRVVASIGSLAPVFTTGHDLSSTRWEIEEVKAVHPRFVIGADGHRSIVRKVLGLEYEPVGAPEVFGVFEFDCDADLPAEVRVVLQDGLTSVLWPLPEGRCRWSFQLSDSEEPQAHRRKSRLAVHVGDRAFPHLERERLGELISERAPWFDARPGEIHWSALVRFERRLSNRFGRGHLWLVGDAAHQTGPVGVQSMNVAMREAEELAERFLDILLDKASLKDLERYEEGRLAEWHRLLGADDALASASGAEDWVTRHRDRILSCIPASGDDLDLLLQQIGLEWRVTEPRS